MWLSRVYDIKTTLKVSQTMFISKSSNTFQRVYIVCQLLMLPFSTLDGIPAYITDEQILLKNIHRISHQKKNE